MGGSHLSHSAPATGSWRSRSHLRLLAVLAPLLLSALVGMLWLWPVGEPPAAAPRLDVREVHEGGVVKAVTAANCPGTEADRLPDGTIPAVTLCASAVVEVTSGDDSGSQVIVPVPPQVYRSGLRTGTRLTLARYPSGNPGTAPGSPAAPSGSDVTSAADAASDVAPSGDVYAWVDFSRGQPLTILAVAFALLVVGVGRLRGVAAMAGLALGYVTIIGFMLPALRLGENSVAVAVSGSTVIMAVILYLAHGFSTKTTTALLGTIFGLLVTTMLAAWSSRTAHLNGLTGEDTYFLSNLTGGADLSGIILCGIIVAGLGVLNDVTVTQASAVWEIHESAPALGFVALFGSGMRVGRDHLASTTYTIAFAYAGAALPTLLLIDLYGRPLGQVLTSGQIAEEVARTLVGAIGLILAIPITTAIAAAAAAAESPSAEFAVPRHSGHAR